MKTCLFVALALFLAVHSAEAGFARFLIVDEAVNHCAADVRICRLSAMADGCCREAFASMTGIAVETPVA